MHIDLKPRGAGKTTQAAAWVKEGRINHQKDTSNRILVVLSEAEKHRIMHHFDLGFHEVETYNSIDHYYLPALRQKELYLDNADRFLQSRFFGLVKGLSITTPIYQTLCV